MSIDLTLLPFNFDSDSLSYSHTVLPLQTNSRDLFEEIEKLAYETSNSIEFITETDISGYIPDGFTSYLARDEEGESCYGKMDTDAYGNGIRWVKASALQNLSNHPQVLKNPLNQMAWGFIKACPPNLKIALFWH